MTRRSPWRAPTTRAQACTARSERARRHRRRRAPRPRRSPRGDRSSLDTDRDPDDRARSPRLDSQAARRASTLRRASQASRARPSRCRRRRAGTARRDPRGQANASLTSSPLESERAAAHRRTCTHVELDARRRHERDRVRDHVGVGVRVGAAAGTAREDVAHAVCARTGAELRDRCCVAPSASLVRPSAARRERLDSAERRRRVDRRRSPRRRARRGVARARAALTKRAPISCTWAATAPRAGATTTIARRERRERAQHLARGDLVAEPPDRATTRRS